MKYQQQRNIMLHNITYYNNIIYYAKLLSKIGST